MRSAATIEKGNVIVIVSLSAIFPLDGSITMPPASGFAFDASSSSCAKLAPAMAITRTQGRRSVNRRIGAWANGRTRRFAVSPIRRFILLSLWRQLLYPAQIGVGFGCLSDAPLALLAFV